MSNTKMLIDATHPEETRVVVQRNGRVEEFDFESAARKLLRGNIYLAKVTRVEPSLQAAFVDYGGNRHGFLAFNEIHPDYYQIPVADRQALLDEEAAAEAELEAAADRRAEALARRNSTRGGGSAAPHAEGEATNDDFAEQSSEDSEDGESTHIVDVEEDDEHIEEIGGDEDEEPIKVLAVAVPMPDDDVISEPVRAEAADNGESNTDLAASASSDEPAAQADADHARDESDDHDHHHDAEAGSDVHADDDHGSEHDEHEHEHHAEQPHVHDHHDHHGGEIDDSQGAEFHEEAPQRPRRRPRSYKIQEVIKRRQIILVQVVKEERGNKGAALTTYLSLAGRYTVLMPNTARGGGISRKITNPQDRRRLKAIAQELEVPEGMGLIIRTAGAARTKQEIKRDFEYLLRLWESVRDLTLQSTAPSLVYEEGDLIKRSIRDLYNKDVEEIVVAGDAGHQEAADFMKMLMPSHAKNVVAYREPTPLFTRYGVERQLNAMFQPQVTLRSGGYIVINQTEALVAIDVNSGKSTREFSIEETALATNLEAADEIARQLKLRDLAGLIVIDFIDMEEKRNNRAVERRLKDALRFDRARIQLGRISHFGLMEMSRQRLRTGVLEGSTSQCPHCQGTGIIRSTESIALAVLRGLEDAITAGATGPLTATTTPPVALYILNSKRAYVTDMEHRHGYSVTVLGSDRVQGANFTIERGGPAVPVRRVERAAVNMDWGFDGEEEAPTFEGGEIETVSHVDDGDEDTVARENGRGEGDESGGRRGRRRRRRGRGGRERGESRERFSSEPRGEDDHGFAAGPQPHGDDDGEQGPVDEDDLDAQPASEEAELGEHGENGANGEKPARRRRRGRRGGRRGRDRNREGGPMHADDANGVAEGEDHEQLDSGDTDGDTEAAQPETWSNGGHITEALSSEDVATAVEQPELKVPRQQRLWDVPSKAQDADEVVMLEGTASEVATEEPQQAVEVPAEVQDSAPAPAPRRRHEIGSSEPRIERVVVRPGDEGSATDAEAQAAPQRKGWWQRKFGGE
ncbi:ribonuclease E/G [Hyphomicrobium sp. MC1]|uniref:Rne/Rng family ribonuclease n=1 Tax=Hyphomicrobium sp. (strain MC1) TaxID=717785 RepID=UPI000213DFB8|nr:ribonuclease E/G [Hyphomicrobium sp. MC1]CCB66412.1 putative ribonuclease [Hyphomicrobium sp. MC1]